MSFSFVERFIHSVGANFKRTGAQAFERGVLQLITPQVANGQPAVIRLVLGGATIIGLVASGVLAAAAAAILLAAMGALYFLLTQVLGIKLEFDPAAFAKQAQDFSQGMPN